VWLRCARPSGWCVDWGVRKERTTSNRPCVRRNGAQKHALDTATHHPHAVDRPQRSRVQAIREERGPALLDAAAGAPRAGAPWVGCGRKAAGGSQVGFALATARSLGSAAHGRSSARRAPARGRGDRAGPSPAGTPQPDTCCQLAANAAPTAAPGGAGRSARPRAASEDGRPTPGAHPPLGVGGAARTSASRSSAPLGPGAGAASARARARRPGAAGEAESSARPRGGRQLRRSCPFKGSSFSGALKPCGARSHFEPAKTSGTRHQLQRKLSRPQPTHLARRRHLRTAPSSPFTVASQPPTGEHASSSPCGTPSACSGWL